MTTTQCFDDLNIPPEHPGRSKSDTHYLTDTELLRTHTSAHKTQHLRQGHEAFLCTGDVYRRDEIDASHFPAFHQMEGVRVFEKEEWESKGVEAVDLARDELRTTLEGLARHLFGDVEMRWVDAYFPFTEPSMELEIFFKGE